MENKNKTKTLTLIKNFTDSYKKNIVLSNGQKMFSLFKVERSQTKIPEFPNKPQFKAYVTPNWILEKTIY